MWVRALATKRLMPFNDDRWPAPIDIDSSTDAFAYVSPGRQTWMLNNHSLYGPVDAWGSIWGSSKKAAFHTCTEMSSLSICIHLYVLFTFNLVCSLFKFPLQVSCSIRSGVSTGKSVQVMQGANLWHIVQSHYHAVFRSHLVYFWHAKYALESLQIPRRWHVYVLCNLCLCQESYAPCMALSIFFSVLCDLHSCHTWYDGVHVSL